MLVLANIFIQLKLKNEISFIVEFENNKKKIIYRAYKTLLTTIRSVVSSVIIDALLVSSLTNAISPKPSPGPF